MIYAGFWRRIWAMFLDGLVVGVVIAPLALAASNVESRAQFLAYQLLILILTTAYQIGLLAAWGRTPGKMAVRARVLRVDGTPIGLKEASLRYSVELALGAAAMVTLSSIVGSASEAEWALRGLERSQYLAAKQLAFLKVFPMTWMLSEYVVLLFNARKRGPQDFIAGTVVVLDPKKEAVPA